MLATELTMLMKQQTNSSTGSVNNLLLQQQMAT